MSDFVKKEDAIRICKMCASAKYRVPYIEQAFENISTIDAVSEWIPCSERLPEENGQSYLTYQGGKGWGFCQVLYYDDGWNCYHGDKENEIKRVVAWMPLPEPYKESE